MEKCTITTDNAHDALLELMPLESVPVCLGGKGKAIPTGGKIEPPAKKLHGTRSGCEVRPPDDGIHDQYYSPYSEWFIYGGGQYGGGI